MHRHGVPCALILTLVLAGCGSSEPAPAGVAEAPAVPAAAPGAAAAATQFDGRWTGHFVLVVSTGSSCGGSHQRGMVVQNGVASVTYNRSLQSNATGEIQPDGKVTLLATGNQAMRLEGQFEGNRFSGTMESGGVRQRCHYDIEMTKRS